MKLVSLALLVATVLIGALLVLRSALDVSARSAGRDGLSNQVVDLPPDSHGVPQPAASDEAGAATPRWREEALIDDRIPATYRDRLARARADSDELSSLCIEVGLVFCRQANFQMSDQWYERAEQYASHDSPEYAQALFLRSWNRVAVDDPRAAFTLFQDVAQCPGATKAVRATALYQIGVLYETKMKDLVRAKEAYKRFVDESAADLGEIHPFVTTARLKMTGDNLEREAAKERK